MFNSSPERVAWITLITAFCICLLIAALGTVVGNWFLFDSNVNLATHLRVGRGTVGVRNTTIAGEEVVRISRDLIKRDYVTTDEVAQGYIEVVDTRSSDQVIMQVLVLPGSQVQLLDATRPRFNFSDSGYVVRLGDFRGRLEIDIPPDLPRDLTLIVDGLHGEVTLTEGGLYLIWSLADSMTLIPRVNSALLQPFGQDMVEILPGQTATIDVTEGVLSIIPTTDELIQNPLFLNATESGVPDEWGCYSIAEDPAAPRGSIRLDTVDGRAAMWIRREGELLGYGETGCRQFIGERQEGLDVTSYRTLRIRATMDIRWHSLAICGSRASECALMLELSYINESGAEQRWIHGFYAFEHANPELPRSCISCLSEHDRITSGNWYTFESSNLFDLPEGFRPTRLKEIRFYTSGHEYEVLVGEIALLAER